MKVTKKHILKFIIGLFVFPLIILSLDFYIEEIGQENNELKEFPDVKLSTVFGETKKISNIDSEVILVDFWFSKCIPCIQEMHFFNELLDKYQDRLTIISYSIDSEEHTKKILLSDNVKWSFLDAKNPNWIFCNSNSKNSSLVKQLKVNYFPTYYLINSEGKVISKPKSGIYGIDKELEGSFSIKTTLKKYLFYFDISKLVISIVLYLLLVIFYLLVRFVFSFLRKRYF